MTKPDYAWWVQHAHEDSACLQLLTGYETFKTRVLERAHATGRTDLTTLVNHCTYRAMFEQDRFGSMTTILDDIHPIPVSTGGRPLRGTLTTEFHALRDAEGTFPAVGASAFWAPWATRHNPAQLERMAQWAKDAGMTYVRWFGAHDWSGGVSLTTPNYFDLMHDTIDALAAHNLRSAITLFTRRHMIQNPAQSAKEWASVINAHRDAVCLVEICNEWNHSHNGWTDEDVQTAGHALLEHCNAPVAFSAPAAETWDTMHARLGDLYTNTAATATTIHFPRRDDTHERAWRWVRQPWHARFLQGCPAFRVDNEHQSWNKSASGKSVSTAAAALCIALIAGCGMTAHHDEFGVWNLRGEYQHDVPSQQLQQVLHTVIPSLPTNLPNWQPVRVGDGGGPHPFPCLLDQHWSFDGDLDHGVSRAFAAVQPNNHPDRHFAMVLSGVKNYVRLRTVQPRTFQVTSLEDGSTIYRGVGPVRLSHADGKAFYVGTDIT